MYFLKKSASNICSYTCFNEWDHYFIAQLSVRTSCQLIYCIHVILSPDHKKHNGLVAGSNKQYLLDKIMTLCNVTYLLIRLCVYAACVTWQGISLSVCRSDMQVPTEGQNMHKISECKCSLFICLSAKMNYCT